MLPQILTVNYLDRVGKRKTRSIVGLRKDLTNDQIRDFTDNSGELMDVLEIASAFITTKRPLI